jgi:hypothetical protein
VTVERIDTTECLNKTLQVMLLDNSGASLDTFDVIPSATEVETDRSSQDINAGLVDRIAVTSRD